MIKKALLLKIFSAAFMQRWNDKIRPLELTELDKQAHKMMIAYFLGKFEERQEGFSWIEIIEGGIFELLQRVVVTDLKPQIFYKIKENKNQYRKLNEWVYQEVKPFILPLGDDFCQKFKNYFQKSDNNFNQRILGAAHHFATAWEFEIIKRANPLAHDLRQIKKDLKLRLKSYQELKGFRELKRNPKLQKIIDLCGQLRFQTRWATVHRVPKTSVLGHMLFVAILAYLFSLEIGAGKKRLINNFLTGLFHDLPEVLTRDIISPVKRSIEGLGDLIKAYEKEQMEKEIYSLLPKDWHPEIKMFTEEEFMDIVGINGEIKRDGELVRAADELCAFLEAHVSIQNGGSAQELRAAKSEIMNRYQRKVIAGINFGQIYADFE